MLPDSPLELAATAAIASSLAAFGALVVASLSYRAQQPRVKVFLGLEGGVANADLVVEVANSGRVACTILRVGFAYKRRRFGQESRSDTVWTYGGPTGDGNVQRYRLDEYDATAWKVSRPALLDALGGANPSAVRAFVQIGDGRLVRSKFATIH
jgi:hypothetical protein